MPRSILLTELSRYYLFKQLDNVSTIKLSLYRQRPSTDDDDDVQWLNVHLKAD